VAGCRRPVDVALAVKGRGISPAELFGAVVEWECLDSDWGPGAELFVEGVLAGGGDDGTSFVLSVGRSAHGGRGALCGRESGWGWGASPPPPPPRGPGRRDLNKWAVRFFSGSDLGEGGRVGASRRSPLRLVRAS